MCVWLTALFSSFVLVFIRVKSVSFLDLLRLGVYLLLYTYSSPLNIMASISINTNAAFVLGSSSIVCVPRSISSACQEIHSILNENMFTLQVFSAENIDQFSNTSYL